MAHMQLNLGACIRFDKHARHIGMPKCCIKHAATCVTHACMHAHQHCGSHKETSCDQQMQAKASQQALAVHSIYDPLHSLPLPSKDKLQYSNNGCCCEASDDSCCKGNAELRKCVTCVPARCTIDQLLVIVMAGTP